MKNIYAEWGFGINVFNGYGITEMSPVVAVNSRSGYRAGSVVKYYPVQSENNK